MKLELAYAACIYYKYDRVCEIYALVLTTFIASLL